MLQRFMYVLMGSLLSIAATAQDPPTGTWTGAIRLPGIELRIRVHFAGPAEALGATIDIPQQGAAGLPLQNVRYTPPRLHFELPAGPGLAVFDGAVSSDGRAEGTFTQAEYAGTFTLASPDAPPLETEPAEAESAFRQEAATLETATGTLHGTLMLPDGDPPYPVALLIAGSGPTDRDGNSDLLPGSNNSFKLLAEALAAEGIATLRYDKRGVGASVDAAASEWALRFETYIDDAVGWLQQFRRDERFSSLTTIGHSEGSLIGMPAAREGDADAFISVAGAGRPAPEILRDQLGAQLPPPLMQQADSILDQLVRGDTVGTVPPELNVLFRPSVQPYLVSWFRHDPTEELAAITLPVLIVQGTTDVQIGVEDAERLAQANPGAELRVIEGMNHVLKLVPDDRDQQLRSYGDPSLPVAPALTEAIVQFIRSHTDG